MVCLVFVRATFVSRRITQKQTKNGHRRDSIRSHWNARKWPKRCSHDVPKHTSVTLRRSAIRWYAWRLRAAFLTRATRFSRAIRPRRANANDIATRFDSIRYHVVCLVFARDKRSSRFFAAKKKKKERRRNSGFVESNQSQIKAN